MKYTLAFALALALASCVKEEWAAPEAAAIAAPGTAVSSLSEDFNSLALVDGQHLLVPKGWCNTGRAGWHRAFQTAVFGETFYEPASDSIQCVQATAYLALGDTTDSWLITPPLLLKDGADFSFDAAVAYNSNSRAVVELRCYFTSTDSLAAPDLSKPDSWTLVATLSASAGSASSIPFAPRAYTLSSYKSVPTHNVAYVALRYLARGRSSWNTWYFDNLKYN
jgi:hypothetical protein